MRHALTTCLALLSAAWLAACATALPPRDDSPRDHHVHVLSNGWHTTILAPRAAVAASGLLPEAAHFPDAAILAFGWGDRAYYPAPEATLGLTLRAALLPTPSVMQISPRDRLPEAGGATRIVRVPLTRAGFRGLVRAVSETIERPSAAGSAGPAEPVAPGLSPRGRFYPARGTFHLFNTCNTWTARMLRAGGVPISPAGVITAGDVMGRLRAALE